MFAACFSISGWAGPQKYIFYGNNLIELVNQLNDVQDLACLTRMGRQFESDNSDAMKELDRLDEFITRYYNDELDASDIETFDIGLSVGIMKCIEFDGTKGALKRMKEKYPNAIVK